MKRLLLPALAFLTGMAGFPPNLSAAARPDPAALRDLPVQDGGRRKPLLAFAQEQMRALNGRLGALKDGTDGARIPALTALLSLWLEPEGWNERRVVLVDDVPLKKALGLPETERLFSAKDLIGRPALMTLAREASSGAGAKPPPLARAAQTVAERVILLQTLMIGKTLALAPPAAGGEGKWTTLEASGDAVLVETRQRLAEAWRANDAAAFAAAAATLKERTRARNPAAMPEAWRLRLESLYLKGHPFRAAWICCVLAAFLLAMSHRGTRGLGYRAGWALSVAALLFQAVGFTIRSIVTGRAPVTNMYETVVWLAFAALAIAVFLEARHRARGFLLASTPLAAAVLLLADLLPTALDSSLHPLVPVLRSNFWLATHVITITTSYASLALALALAHGVLWKALRERSRTAGGSLHGYVDRALQIGVLLLAAGTILGGVWANYSWGRFWGWDPKETWALIALLTYLFLLHGRLVRWWAGFGVAVGAILGFQSVIMAWYGVNFVLGVGLHSYGFGSGGIRWALLFLAAECAFIAWASWRSRPART
ncbi:MAG: cytochrome c biogenesis protein CcsA [Verrucomicrobiae bacterium]|nr:cytochrome c biogenesis protein CcsA [Verrucomicrobiae bacterium]